MKAPKDERQLDLFSDPRREWALAVIEALEQNADKINYLHDLMQKVLDGVPGYASPEHVKRMRAFRRKQRRVLGIGSTVLKSTVRGWPKRHGRSQDRSDRTRANRGQ